MKKHLTLEVIHAEVENPRFSFNSSSMKVKGGVIYGPDFYMGTVFFCIFSFYHFELGMNRS